MFTRLTFRERRIINTASTFKNFFITTRDTKQ
jgi:hypothetical protein